MRRIGRLAPVLVGAGLLGVFASSCARSPGAVSARPLRASARSGAQLWADNCARCHASRAPESYSDAQWELVVHHMANQARLTGPERRAIAEFLKSSN